MHMHSFGSSVQAEQPKKLSHGKPGIFSGFLRFLLFSFYETQNKKEPHPKNLLWERFGLKYIAIVTYF